MLGLVSSLLASRLHPCCDEFSVLSRTLGSTSVCVCVCVCVCCDDVVFTVDHVVTSLVVCV